MWNLPIKFQNSQTNWKCQCKVPPHLWHTLGTDLFYWNRIKFIMIGDYFTKFIIIIIIRKLPNSSNTHCVKGTRDGFHWIWMTIHSEKQQWTMLQFQGIPAVPWVLPSSPCHKLPPPSMEQWSHWSSGGHFKEVDGKVHQRREAMELWVIAVSCNPNFQHHSITTWSPHREEQPGLSLPQIPSSIGKTVESSRIWPGTHQMISLSTFTSYSMDLEPGQPVFIKEVHGNVWKTGTIDQPAREPDSYWVRFPDDSILRRTHQMIKPRLLPSHFELETQSSERNMQEYRTSKNQQSFQTMFQDMARSALQTGNLVAPAFHETRMASMERQNIATSSSNFLWCDTTFYSSSSEEIILIPQRVYHPGDSLPWESNCASNVLSVWMVWTFGTQWNMVEGSFQTLISHFSDYFCFIQLTVWVIQYGYSYSAMCL